GKVEPNWTSPAIVPIMVLAHQYLQQRQSWKRWLVKLLPLTLVLVLVFRMAMIVDFIPAQAIVERYHAWKGWPEELKQKTHGLPVVFNNSYQRASKYAFYTGAMTYSLNKFDERRNNYNFWPMEDSLLGKPVYVMDIYGINRFQDSIETPLYTIGYSFDSSYHSFAKIMFKADNQVVKAPDSLEMDFTVTLPSHYRSYLANHPEVSPKMALSFFDGQKMVKYIELPFTLQEVVNKSINQLSVMHGLSKGAYFMRFGVMSDSELYSHNSEKIKLEVLEP
ncbi:MAG TPA: hypothetical protein VEB42_11185, partial [Chitinophagaceae bacterium]|nr:hypothetical protein [Chitinophagaceae bacterium]